MNWRKALLSHTNTDPRPNILCVVSEDCGAYHLGPYGGPASTPAIDRLARDGVRWQNAFSVAPVCAPSRFAMITGLTPESYSPAHQMRAAGTVPNFLDGAGWPRMLRNAGYYCVNNSKEDYNTAMLDIAQTWDESSPRAHWRNRLSGAPFFAIFNLDVTHESQVHGTPEFGSISPAHVRLPPYSPDTETTRTDMATYMLRIQQMDTQLGALLAELEQDGLADDTIVLYYSDHAGVLLRSKRFCYDSGLHVPLIARFGRNFAHLSPACPGSVLAEPVTTSTSLPPTILNLARCETPAWMRGTAFAGSRRGTARYAYGMRQRMDERYDMVRTVRDERYRYLRNYMPHLPNGQHIDYQWQQAGYQEWEELLRRQDLSQTQLQFWYQRPAEELYDTHQDPHETSNLIDNPAYSNVHRRMSAALDHHMLSVNDNGFIPESRTPYSGAYPLQQVMQLAATAIQRAPSNIHRLLHAFSSDNEVIRYWAVQGVCMLAPHAQSAAATLQNALAAEPSPHVKIVVAEALLRHAAHDSAIDYLCGTLATNPDPYLRLQAVQALDNIGEGARAALPQLLNAAAQAQQWPRPGLKKLTPADIEELKKAYTRNPDSQANHYTPLAARHTARKLQHADFAPQD
ncbi:sulfatase-like hydrolase/transferase [Mycobacteroides abscessus]|nr:sulfatase-like hydrolase/transferase [Mycobacteroides abscessus]